MGAARDGGRSAARRPRRTCPTSRTRATPSWSGSRASASTTPTRSAPAWDEALARRPARACSRRSPTPRCRRCRRTSRSSRPRTLPRRCVKGDPHAGGMIERVDQGQGRRVRHRRDERGRAPIAAPSSARRRGVHGADRRARRRTARSRGTRPRSSSSRCSRGGARGLGYTYADVAAAQVGRLQARDVVAAATPERRARPGTAMVRAIRNARPSRPRVDGDLRGRHRALGPQGAPARTCRSCGLLGACRDDVPIYGSRRLHLLLDERLADQLAGWVDQGIPRVKMKVGVEPGDDPAARARGARRDRPRTPSCSSTRTAPTPASRRSSWPSASATRRA